MEFHLDAELRQMPGKATWNSSFDSFTTVLELLDDHHAEILRQSFLWPLYQLREVQYSGQIIDALLCRLLKPVDGNVFHFSLGGKVAIFSIFEFALITGLKITDDEAARDNTQRCSRLHDTYFQGQGTVLLPQLIGAVSECDQMLDKLKLGLVYILESVMRCHHKKTTIDLFHLEIVDDIDGFNNYPWGQRCFEDTVHIFTRSHSKPKGFVRKYDTYGLPLALQIWAYETVPLLGTRFARRGETRCPRMLHWQASRPDGCPSGKQLSDLIDDPHLEVITEMTSSMDENGQGLVRELAFPHTQDDQMSESILDRDLERDPIDRRSPPSRAPPSSRRSRSPPSSHLPPSRAPPSSRRSRSPPFGHLPRGSPANTQSRQFDDLYARLTRYIAEEVGALRRELIGRVDDMERQLIRRVDDLSYDVGVLRGHFVDLQDEVAALRGDIARRRWRAEDQFDDLYARLTRYIAEEVRALRRELIGRVDDLGRQLTRRVDDLSYDVGVLRGHFVNLQDEVAALRGDIANRRWRAEDAASSL